MNTSQQTRAISDTIIDSRRLITGLRQALDLNYARVLAAASGNGNAISPGKIRATRASLCGSAPEHPAPEFCGDQPARF